jgi:two-component system sensor histidine kinase KdpD
MEKKITNSASNNPLFLVGICILVASIISFVCTALLGVIDLANIVMIFLLSTFLIAITLGRGTAIYSAFINVGFFDFFFVTPRFSFTVDDSQYLIIFLVMLTVGLVTGNLAARLKEQIQDISTRERLAKALQSLSQGLFNAKTDAQIIQVAKSALETPIGVELDIFITDHPEQLKQSRFDSQTITWAMQSGSRIFHEVEELDGNSAIFIPIRAELKTFGILIASDPTKSLKRYGRDDLLQIASNLIALAIAQLRSSKAEELSKIDVATERLKSAILSSLSHDLRTPLTTMIGLAERLCEKIHNMDDESKNNLETIKSQGLRLSNMIGNLLEMAKLQTQGPTLKKEWQPIEEVVGTSIKYFTTSFPKNVIRIKINSDVPPLLFDEVLIERVICNLLENAAKYSNEASTINLNIYNVGKFVEVSVMDDGKGFDQDPDQLFEMFARGLSDTNKAGMGLGLAICKEIVEAHGGTISAKNNADQKGSTITFTLPITKNGELPKL